MKPFHSWVEGMANSIEDASTIVKDEHGEIVHKVPKTFAERYAEMYVDEPPAITQQQYDEYYSKIRYSPSGEDDDYDDDYFD